MDNKMNESKETMVTFNDVGNEKDGYKQVMISVMEIDGVDIYDYNKVVDFAFDQLEIVHGEENIEFAKINSVDIPTKEWDPKRVSFDNSKYTV
jgi:hypothetical protein